MEKDYRIYDVGDDSRVQSEIDYVKSVGLKKKLIVLISAVTVVSLFVILYWGNCNFTLAEVIAGFFSFSNETVIGRYIWNIDMPIIIAAMIAGAGLSLAGTAMQCVLRNPLASPYTLGLSSAAAFGAAFSVIYLNSGFIFSNPLLGTYRTPLCAFLFSMVATVAILLLTRVTRVSSETMVLGGIAISAIFSAGLTLMQYMADPVQLSTIVSWTFGSVAYTSWSWDLILFAVLVLVAFFFFVNRWNMNTMDAGDEVAKGLGINTERFLTVSMVLASLLAAFMVSKFGVIAFVGLLGPHMARMLIGDDHRFLIPMSILIGMLLMLVANAVAMNIVRPMILPVGLLTSLLGGPAFMYLLIRRYRK